MGIPLVVTADLEPDGFVLIRARGEMDLTTFAIFDEQHRVHTRESRPARLDLGDVTFIDSAGLAALILARQRSEEHGVALQCVRVSDFVCAAMTLARLGDWLCGKQAPDPTAA